MDTFIKSNAIYNCTKMKYLGLNLKKLIRDLYVKTIQDDKRNWFLSVIGRAYFCESNLDFLFCSTDLCVYLWRSLDFRLYLTGEEGSLKYPTYRIFIFANVYFVII